MRFSLTALILCLSPLFLGSSCASRISPTPVAAPPSAQPPATATLRATPPANGSNSVPDIARREVIRRKEMIRQMDEAAIRASQKLANDDLEGAVEGYRRAIGQ